MKDIFIKAEGFRLVPDWAVAGTRGSYGVSRLNFEFSDAWESLQKSVTFFPGGGESGVKVIMNEGSVIIPPEVLAVAGNSTFVLDGFREGAKLISLVGRLRVVDTATPGGTDSVTPTPSELEQIRLSIVKLRTDAKVAENSIRGELELITADISSVESEIKKQFSAMESADEEHASRIASLRREMLLLNSETLEREDYINECITQSSEKINANKNDIASIRSALVRTNAETKSELDALRASVPTVEDGREGNVVVFGKDGALVDSGCGVRDASTNKTYYGNELISRENTSLTSFPGGFSLNIEKPGRYFILNTSTTTTGSYSITSKTTSVTQEYELAPGSATYVYLTLDDVFYMSYTLSASWLSYALPHPLGVADDFYINCSTGEIFICISADDEHSYWLFYDRLNISEADLIPAHWKDHLDDQISTINYMIEEGRADCFSFIVLTDMHYEENISMLSPHIAKKLSDECNIKYVLCLGDLQSEGSAEKTEVQSDTEWKKIGDALSPINDRLLLTQGEYDGVYGRFSTNDDISSYRNTNGKLYQKLFAPVAMKHNATFSSDGRGYFVDDISHRVRYIMLSSYANSDRTNVEGAILYTNSENFRFGTPQLTLVRDALMSIPSDDYSVVIASHRPLDRDGSFTAWGGSGTGGDAIDRYGEATLMIRLLNAYVGRGSFSGSFEGTQTDDDGKYDSSSISADFSSAKGRLIGFFSGGTHRDEAFEPGTAENGGVACNFFVFTTRCDGNVEHDSESSDERNECEISEQCFDVFTVNKKTGLVYATRIGVGSDREFYI